MQLGKVWCDKQSFVAVGNLSLGLFSRAWFELFWLYILEYLVSTGGPVPFLCSVPTSPSQCAPVLQLFPFPTLLMVLAEQCVTLQVLVSLAAGVAFSTQGVIKGILILIPQKRGRNVSKVLETQHAFSPKIPG